MPTATDAFPLCIRSSARDESLPPGGVTSRGCGGVQALMGHACSSPGMQGRPCARRLQDRARRNSVSVGNASAVTPDGDGGATAPRPAAAPATDSASPVLTSRRCQTAPATCSALPCHRLSRPLSRSPILPLVHEFKHECIGVGARKACNLVYHVPGEGPTSPLVISFVDQLMIVKGRRVTLVAVIGVWVV